jgi:hypothetical protein
MRRTLLAVLGLATACSSKDAGSSGDKAAPAPRTAAAPVARIATAEQVCDVLTPAEVEAELHENTTARMLPKAGEYGAPECGWLVSDAPGAHGVSVTMFLQDKEADARTYFAHKLDSVCRDGKREVPDLGDEAALCGRLWVRKGTSYFSISLARTTSTPDERIQIGRRLAEHILPHLP